MMIRGGRGRMSLWQFSFRTLGLSPFTRQHVFTTTTIRRLGHSVRVILTSDLPEKSLHQHEIVQVKPGFARNYLIPQKKALYATPQNFQRLGLTDPLAETIEDRRERLAKEQEQQQQQLDEGAEEQKAADVLRQYLRNKTLTIWRNVDKSTNAVHPGMVDAKAVRQKLSKQLKIDLDDDEQVHLKEDPVMLAWEDDMEALEAMMEEMDTSSSCTTQVRQLGEYLAKISLPGGHAVPLRVAVVKR